MKDSITLQFTASDIDECMEYASREVFAYRIKHHPELMDLPFSRHEMEILYSMVLGTMTDYSYHMADNEDGYKELKAIKEKFDIIFKGGK